MDEFAEHFCSLTQMAEGATAQEQPLNAISPNTGLVALEEQLAALQAHVKQARVQEQQRARQHASEAKCRLEQQLVALDSRAHEGHRRRKELEDAIARKRHEMRGDTLSVVRTKTESWELQRDQAFEEIAAHKLRADQL